MRLHSKAAPIVIQKKNFCFRFVETHLFIFCLPCILFNVLVMSANKLWKTKITSVFFDKEISIILEFHNIMLLYFLKCQLNSKNIVFLDNESFFLYSRLQKDTFLTKVYELERFNPKLLNIMRLHSNGSSL